MLLLTCMACQFRSRKPWTSEFYYEMAGTIPNVEYSKNNLMSLLREITNKVI